MRLFMYLILHSGYSCFNTAGIVSLSMMNLHAAASQGPTLSTFMDTPGFKELGDRVSN